MNQSVIQAILLSTKTHVQDCYIVVGSYVGQVRLLNPHQAYYEEVASADLKIQHCFNGVQLWSYEPQKLIQKWQITQNNAKQSQLISIVENQQWQLILKLRSRPCKNLKYQKQAPYSCEQTKKVSKTTSKSKSKSKNKLAVVKQALRQKINLLTVKPQPKANENKLQSYYYSSCSSKYPSFFSNSSNSNFENYKSCLDICAQNKTKIVYNAQAQSIYGFDEPKQYKPIQDVKHLPHKNVLKGLC